MTDLRAFLFDLDGTLTHTDPVHLRAFQHLLADDGLTLDDAGFLEHVSGRANADIGARLFPHRHPDQHPDLLRRKEALFREMATDLQPLAGVSNFVDAARQRGLTLALVTNAPRENAMHILSAIGAEDRFDIIVCGDELPRSKPDPLPYLTALEALGVRANQAVAFEDSPPGVRAAVAAGICTIGIATTRSENELRAAGAAIVVSDYLDPQLSTLPDGRMSDDR